MSNTYYKVVDKNLRSIIANRNSAEGRGREALMDELTVQYVEKQWVRPAKPGTHLMCFDSLSRARNFAYTRDGIVFECKVIKPRKYGFITPFDVFTTYYPGLSYLIRKKQKYSHLQRGYECSPPSSTIFCEAIKLVKQV